MISLAQFTLAYTRGWAANSPNSRIRLKAELDRAHQEIAPLREDVRIKDVRKYGTVRSVDHHWAFKYKTASPAKGGAKFVSPAALAVLPSVTVPVFGSNHSAANVVLPPPCSCT